MDIPCAICAEPWENYELRQEFNTPPENWDDLRDAIKAGVVPEKVKGKDITPYVAFSKGLGCPACKFGQEKPIFAGQVFKARADVPALNLKGGDQVVVESYEQQYGSFTMNVLFALGAVGAARVTGVMDEKEFRKSFELVPTEKDKEREEELKLDAAKKACSASDEEPFGILEERGIDIG